MIFLVLESKDQVKTLLLGSNNINEKAHWQYCFHLAASSQTEHSSRHAVKTGSTIAACNVGGFCHCYYVL